MYCVEVLVCFVWRCLCGEAGVICVEWQVCFVKRCWCEEAGVICVEWQVCFVRCVDKCAPVVCSGCEHCV